MMRLIICFFISLSCFFYSGCVPSMHGLAHPHSEIQVPTFCLYDGRETKQDAKPQPIYRLRVTREEKFSDDARFEWRNWLSWRKKRYADQDTWDIEYAPDGKSNPAEKPFSCITYGKVPPGYVEHIPAQPLIPERLYTVLLRRSKGRPPNSWVYFIIRADAQGHPIQLEHTIHPNDLDRIHIITKEECCDECR